MSRFALVGNNRKLSYIGHVASENRFPAPAMLRCQFQPCLSASRGRAGVACGEQRDYAEPACPRVWTFNDASLAPTRNVYRLIRAISPSGVLASTFSRVSSRCRLAWKSESVVMLRAAASCSESKPKHQSSRLSLSEAVKRGAVDAVDCAWSGT
jgi:hypothetical protein